MFTLDFGNHMALYEQIKIKIKEMIVSGAIGENEKIPSVREMAGSLSINPNTIQKAYKELESEGYVYSVKGKGNFVSPIEKTVDAKDTEELFEKFRGISSELYFLKTDRKELDKILDDIYKE